MKFTWEAKDFRSEGRDKSEFYPYGAVVGRPNSDDRYLIGYNNGTGSNPVLIALSDGAVFVRRDSREAMMEYLNAGGYFPLVDRVKI